MNGPNELTTIGNLRDWNRSQRLGEIQVPALMTGGRYDELGPSCAATLEAGLPDAAYAYSYEHESERLAALPGALDFYNRFRPHRALGGLAPLQRVNNLPGTYS
jgi:transposase InsO family protein